MIAELLSESGLSLERLQSFSRVAEAGGVTRAAKGDATKQSLYSRQIKELEEFFGAELMRRKGRGIVLTTAGERLHAIAREHFAAMIDFKLECQGQPLEIAIAVGLDPDDPPTGVAQQVGGDRGGDQYGAGLHRFGGQPAVEPGPDGGHAVVGGLPPGGRPVVH